MTMVFYMDDFDKKEPKLGWWQTMCSGTEPRNQYRFTGWCLAWAVTFITTHWVLKQDFGLPTSATLVIVLVPIVVGFFALSTYTRFLRATDELVRKIQMESLAIGFGSGLVFALCYPLFEYLGAPPLAFDNVTMALIVGFVVGQVQAMKRYR